MKKIILILFFVTSLSFIIEIHSLTPEQDSLQSILDVNSKKDTVRVNTLNLLANEWISTDGLKAKEYAEEALELSGKLNFTKGKAESLNLIGYFFQLQSDFAEAIVFYQRSLKSYEAIEEKKSAADCLKYIGVMNYYLGNSPEALEYYQKALDKYNEIEYIIGTSACLNNIGIIHLNQSNYPQALDYFQRSLKIDEQLDDKRSIALSLVNLGNICNHQNEPYRAMEYFERSLKIFEEFQNHDGIAMCLNNIGISYQNIDEYSKSLEYFQRVLKLYEEFSDKNGIAVTTNNIGNLYFNIENNSLALEYYLRALEMNLKLKNLSNISMSYFNVGKSYLKSKEFSLALEYTFKSKDIAEKQNLQVFYRNDLLQLSQIYEAQHKYKEAFNYYVLYKEMYDELFNEENLKEITNLENKFEHEKEKQLIETEQLRKDAIAKASAKSQRTIRNFFIIGFVLMGLLVLVILRFFIQKRKVNRILFAQKKEIESKNQLLNKEIDDRTKAEEDLKIGRERLSILNKILRHDLSNDFTVIKSAVKVFKLTSQETLLDEIRKRVETSLETINNYRKYEAFIDSNTALKEIELQEKLNEIFVEYPAVKFNLEGNCKVFADEALNSVFVNLFSNAKKHGKADEIKISISSERNSCKIKIANNGYQIPEIILDKIFDEGFCFGETGNTGIGLHIVKKTIERYDGKISVTENEPNNVVFEITLKQVMNL